MGEQTLPSPRNVLSMLLTRSFHLSSPTLYLHNGPDLGLIPLFLNLFVFQNCPPHQPMGYCFNSNSTFQYRCSPSFVLFQSLLYVSSESPSKLLTTMLAQAGWALVG